jgi:hypothetical protein
VLKREITYETLEDPPRKITEIHYFNLTAPEFVALNPDTKPDTNLEDIDLTQFVAKADDIVLKSYGVKSEDGLSFNKSKKAQKKFRDSLAYNALVDELFSDDTALTVFIRGVLPSKLSEGFDKAISEAKESTPASSPPVPPTS